MVLALGYESKRGEGRQTWPTGVCSGRKPHPSQSRLLVFVGLDFTQEGGEKSKNSSELGNIGKS